MIHKSYLVEKDKNLLKQSKHYLIYGENIGLIDLFDKTIKRVGDDNFKKIPFKNAAKIFREMITKKDFDDFLTLPLYEKL